MSDDTRPVEQVMVRKPDDSLLGITKVTDNSQGSPTIRAPVHVAHKLDAGIGDRIVWLRDDGGVSFFVVDENEWDEIAAEAAEGEA